MDKMIVKGLGKRIDGEYEFSIADMMTLGHPESLTNREAHRLKTMSGVRLGELDDALGAGDSDVFMAIGAILLARAGKAVDEEVLWDAPAGSGFDFQFESLEEEAEAGDGESPPESAASEPTETRSPSGGSSSAGAWEPPANGQSLTGPRDSERFAAYDRPTSVS